VPRAIANFRFFAGAVRHDETALHDMGGALSYTLRLPLGVVGLITPWNLPIYLLSWKTAPALAMGNAVVAKPSELTPLTASALAEIFQQLGAPAGAFNLVHGLGTEAGQALVEHAGVAAISFTGGTATGARVAATAAPAFKKLSLELGGKNPTLVFADADLDAALEGALRAGFMNQGQVCLCGSRLLVQRSIADEFVERYVERVRRMRVGDPRDAHTDQGALISAAHREKVEAYLALARQEGGTVQCGGERPALAAPFDRGAFLTPSVITGLAPSCRTATEEIFGPVVTVHPFDDEDEAVAIANGVRYGLSASIWTRNLDRAHRVSRRLQAGLVWVNTWLLRDLRVPFGGVKDSGVGREGGRWSLEFFSEARNVCVKLESHR
jgi:aminomuconate-semialdehyde/2-hydroxymuconate-6-semialdehyde dehydrogenase